MDCWNFCIFRILAQNNQIYEESNFIFSEVFPWGSLLPKIWLVLLESFNNVEIIHEYKEIFINIKESELSLLEEYKLWLHEFQNKWWIYLNKQITVKFLAEKLDNYYCIIPIQKGKWSHFVILNKIENDKVLLIDNKIWNFFISKDKLKQLINIDSWKYVLFAWKRWFNNKNLFKNT